MEVEVEAVVLLREEDMLVDMEEVKEEAVEVALVVVMEDMVVEEVTAVEVGVDPLEDRKALDTVVVEAPVVVQGGVMVDLEELMGEEKEEGVVAEVEQRAVGMVKGTARGKAVVTADTHRRSTSACQQENG